MNLSIAVLALDEAGAQRSQSPMEAEVGTMIAEYGMSGTGHKAKSSVASKLSIRARGQGILRIRTLLQINVVNNPAVALFRAFAERHEGPVTVFVRGSNGIVRVSAFLDRREPHLDQKVWYAQRNASQA
jgi:hypothetical protein